MTRSERTESAVYTVLLILAAALVMFAPVPRKAPCTGARTWDPPAPPLFDMDSVPEIDCSPAAPTPPASELVVRDGPRALVLPWGENWDATDEHCIRKLVALVSRAWNACPGFRAK